MQTKHMLHGDQQGMGGRTHKRCHKPYAGGGGGGGGRLFDKSAIGVRAGLVHG